jgi:Uma2 family endonuclease
MTTIQSEAQIAAPNDPEWIPAPLYRFTLDQYEAMVDSGAFSGKERLHLINGYLVAKMTQNEPHATAEELCGEALGRVLPKGWHVRGAKPIRIPSTASKPEPDRCVARGGIRDYAQCSPEPGDIALVVEVADSSLSEDRKQAAIYAGGGIPAYWIVNLVDRHVEVYTEPAASGFRARQTYPPGSDVPVIIAGAEVGRIAVNELFP